jgi:hypothetical protein
MVNWSKWKRCAMPSHYIEHVVHGDVSAFTPGMYDDVSLILGGVRSYYLLPPLDQSRNLRLSYLNFFIEVLGEIALRIQAYFQSL